MPQKEEREARDAEQLAKAKKLSAKDSFIGGVTGLGISFVLYGFAQTISASFDGRQVPESYQARQITITVRTIVTGLAYLATFVYAANGTGLVALAAQKTLDKLTVRGEDGGNDGSGLGAGGAWGMAHSAACYCVTRCLYVSTVTGAGAGHSPKS